MPAYKGSLFLLKVRDTLSSGLFITIGGMRTTKFMLNNQSIDTSNKDSGAWRDLLSGAGISSVSVSGTGLFTNSASEITIRQYAFSNIISEYQLCFGSGDIMSGNFLISSYERTGNYNEEETYSISLESSGPVIYIPADNIIV